MECWVEPRTVIPCVFQICSCQCEIPASVVPSNLGGLTGWWRFLYWHRVLSAEIFIFKKCHPHPHCPPRVTGKTLQLTGKCHLHGIPDSFWLTHKDQVA